MITRPIIYNKSAILYADFAEKLLTAGIITPAQT